MQEPLRMRLMMWGLELGIWLSNWTDIQAAHLDKFAAFVFAALGLSFSPNPTPLMFVHFKLVVWNTKFASDIRAAF